MNGMQATRVLRAAGYEGIVLALAAHTDDEHRQQLTDVGCNAVLAKSVTLEQLALVLRAYVIAQVAN